MKIGTHLRKLRDSKALSTRKLAENAGISHSTYMDWEHDKSSPSLKSYFKLAHAFGICPVEMMAYFMDQTSKPMSADDKMMIADMKEMVSQYKKYSESLKKDKEHLEIELVRVQGLLMAYQDTVRLPVTFSTTK